jgi:serine/threonine protein kinase
VRSASGRSGCYWARRQANNSAVAPSLFRPDQTTNQPTNPPTPSPAHPHRPPARTAPEVQELITQRSTGQATYKVDIYSFGVLLEELAKAIPNDTQGGSLASKWHKMIGQCKEPVPESRPGWDEIFLTLGSTKEQCQLAAEPWKGLMRCNSWDEEGGRWTVQPPAAAAAGPAAPGVPAAP